jgi:RNA polymerase sigma factor (sigma-70 family)
MYRLAGLLHPVCRFAPKEVAPMANTASLPQLDDVQAYLAARLAKLAPDALLTQQWEEFYAIYNKVLLGLARHCGMGHANAEDVVQDVWLSAVADLPRLQSGKNSSPRAWLFKVVRNKAVELLRKNRRSHCRSVAGEELERHPAAADDPEAHLQQLWRSELVAAALARLRSDDDPLGCEIIHLQFVEGRKSADVTKRLGMTLEQVRTRRKRLFEKIRRFVAYYTGNDPLIILPGLKPRPRRDSQAK